MHWRWSYFKPHEVLSPDGLAQYAEKGNLLVQPYALDQLQRLRAAYGHPLRCNFGNLRRRGYRSPRENAQAGGSPFSRHVQGIAFDITPDGETLAHLMVFLEHTADKWGLGGIGFYPRKNFIHIDFRARTFPDPTFWVE